MRHRSIAALGMALTFAVLAPCDGLGQAAPPDTPAAKVTVDAAHPWIDTGLNVSKGERLSFTAVGTIQWGSQPGQVAGPEGHDARAGKLGKGGLIGRVGMTGKPFAIGNTKTPTRDAQEWRTFPRHQRFRVR